MIEIRSGKKCWFQESAEGNKVPTISLKETSRGHGTFSVSESGSSGRTTSKLVVLLWGYVKPFPLHQDNTRKNDSQLDEASWENWSGPETAKVCVLYWNCKGVLYVTLSYQITLHYMICICILYHIILYYITLHYITLHYTTSYHIISYHFILYHIILYSQYIPILLDAGIFNYQHIMRNHIVLYRIAFYHTIAHCVMLYCVMLCCFGLCSTMPVYVALP